MKKLTLAIFSLLLLAPVFSQKSALRIFQKTFKTYMYSDPDPVPHPQSNIYPYFRFDGYTDEPVDKDWTIVELENEWIKVHITPEIGGKIWGAWEKSTGFPFVYANDVVKFRDVAMRGAWTSGGIEFNFGDIGHAPTVATPVDWTTCENADGSVSCFVGALDLSSRTRWMVEINLPADKAYFTTRSRWYNCTPFETSYYHWMNGGFRAEGDLEFCFPGTNYIGHEGELHTWPIDEKGRDLSRYKNNDFGSYKSYHVLGEPTDWFGGYWHDDDMGVVHYSPYADKLGKKIWIWGLSRQGYIWEDLLTDNSGQYVELQSGRLFNQASPGSINSPFKHVAFKPYTTDEWTEYWYPVKGTGGIDWASKLGALNLKSSKDGIVVDFCPIQFVNDSIKIYESIEGTFDRKVRYLFGQKLELSPLKKISLELGIKPENINHLIIKIGDEIIKDAQFEDDGFEPLRTLKSAEDFDLNSGYGQYLKGKDFMNQRRYTEALTVFDSILTSDPYNLKVLIEMAEIYMRRVDDFEGYKNALKVLSIDTYEAKANLMLGIMALEEALEEDLGEVEDLFSVAALDPNYRSAAYYYLALIQCKKMNWTKAVEQAKMSIAASPLNSNTQNLLMALYRKTNRSDDAKLMQEKILGSDPLNHVARFEKYLSSKSEANRQTFITPIKSEMAYETFIEIADWYVGIYMSDEAMDVMNLVEINPKAALWKGRISLNTSYQADMSRDEWYDEAYKLNPGLEFPFRKRENFQLGGDDRWKSMYYQALYYWHGGEIENAKKWFQGCKNTPDYPPFYLAKADLFKDEPTVVLESLERAWALAPGDWRTAVRLANYHLENGNPAKALEYAEAGQKAHPKHSPMGLVYAKTLNANGLYEQCAAFLKNYKVLPAEGAYQAHDIWREANLHVALAKMTAKKWKDALPWLDAAMSWPENLGSGKPYFPDERLPMWMKAHCFQQLKRQGEAGVAKDYLFSYNNPDEAPGYLGEFLTALALRDAVKLPEAQQRLAAAPIGNTPAVLQDWCKQKLEGQNPPAPTVELSRDWKVAMRFLEMLGK